MSHLFRESQIINQKKNFETPKKWLSKRQYSTSYTKKRDEFKLLKSGNKK